MPVPWRVLTTILKQAPLIVAAADTLRTTSEQRRAAAHAVEDIEALRQRVAGIEHQQHASTELLKQLADHAGAMTAAAQATAVTMKRVFFVAIAALVVSVAALLVAVLI